MHRQRELEAGAPIDDAEVADVDDEAIGHESEGDA
jgi:hypothetical protein